MCLHVCRQVLLLPAGLTASVFMVEHIASAVSRPAAPRPSEAHKLVGPGRVLQGIALQICVFLLHFHRTLPLAGLTAESLENFLADITAS